MRSSSIQGIVMRSDMLAHGKTDEPTRGSGTGIATGINQRKFWVRRSMSKDAELAGLDIYCVRTPRFSF